MKTRQSILWMKKQGIMLILAISCMLPTLSSCSSEESSSVDFAVAYQSHLPMLTDTDIVAAILDYQEQQGLINRHIPVTIEGSEISDEDFNNMTQQVIQDTYDKMNEYDYNQVIRDAGLSVSAPLTLRIQYAVGPIEAANGTVIPYGNIQLTINLQ